MLWVIVALVKIILLELSVINVKMVITASQHVKVIANNLIIKFQILLDYCIIHIHNFSL